MIKPLVTVLSIVLGSATLGLVVYMQGHSAPRYPKIVAGTTLPGYLADGSLSETPKALLDAMDSKAQVHIVLVNPVFIVNAPAAQKDERSKSGEAPPRQSGGQRGPTVPDQKNWVPAIIVQ